MNYTEKSVPMENGALDKVLGQYKTTKTILTILPVLIAVILIVTIIAEPSSVILMLALGIIAIGTPIVLLFYLKLKNEKLLEDEKNKQKIIIKGHLTNKTYRFYRRGMYDYYFIVGNRKLMVSTKDYEKYRTGSLIEVHIAPKSNHVININAISHI